MQTTSEALEDEPGRSGVRVYRGRKISDVLPTIRAELGADAVILRHREGVGGGVGGFVEVEAMPGAPRVDVFDDEASDGLEDLFRAPAASEDAPEISPEAVEIDRGGEPQAAPASGAQAFLQRLAEAATETPSPVASRETPFEPMPLPAPAASAHRSVAGTATGNASVSVNGVAVAPRPSTIAMPAPSPRTRVNGAAGIYADTAAAAVASGELQAPLADPSDGVTMAPAPVAAAREARIQSTDREAASAITEELVGRGMGAEHAERLILEAASHVLPFVPGGDLREAVRRTLARRLAGLAAPPMGGSVVAFVGAGGSGKTRCVAGLAAAYQGTSTLETSCLSVTPEDGGSELNGLLRTHGIAVRAAEPGAGAAWLATVRDAGLVIVDTPAVRVNDETSVRTLAGEIAALAPDHVLVTLPAPLSAAAARQLLDRLAPLQPTGIVVTHVDETDQLGVAVDLACDSALPLAYVHDGLELPGALVPADPQDIAGRLLP
jgi:flagellar biosynthesis GTPase FlhF